MLKILLAVDGSEPSVRAANKLVESLAWYKERPAVEVMTVHLPVPAMGRIGAVVTQAMIDKYYSEEEAEATAPARAVLDAAGVPYTVHAAVGPIAPTLVARANEIGAAMIYMGTRGMGALSNAVLGSVPTKVLHLSKVPVVLIP